MSGYFLVADILGFSQIVTNKTIDVHARIAQWTELVDECADEYDISQLQLISDTLFAACPSSSRQFLNLLRFGRSLLERGIKRSLPIRGAIGQGAYAWGRLTYGDTVIRCYKAEQNQAWIGIMCLPHMSMPEEILNSGLVTLYPAPCRNAPIQLNYVVVWDPPFFDELSRLLVAGGLAREGQPLPQEWLVKMHNTLLFKYCQRIKSKAGVPPHQFHGLPLQLIEAQLYGRQIIYDEINERLGLGDFPPTPC